MVKFLVSKNLLSLTTFSSSYQDERDFAAVDLHSILAAMKQVCFNTYSVHFCARY